MKEWPFLSDLRRPELIELPGDEPLLDLLDRLKRLPAADRIFAYWSHNALCLTTAPAYAVAVDEDVGPFAVVWFDPDGRQFELRLAEASFPPRRESFESCSALQASDASTAFEKLRERIEFVGRTTAAPM